MAKVSSDITMSLDGFIAGPNDHVQQPLGEGGERLHEWLSELATFRKLHGQSGGRSDRDDEVLDEAFRDTGAFIMGKRMFDLGEKYWGDDPPFHHPVFVMTHQGREKLSKAGGTTFTFVTDGIDVVLAQAKAAAGEKNVLVSGGAQIIQQLLRAGLLDEIQIHLVPLILGGGRRLLENLDGNDLKLERSRVIDSAQVTHLRFRVHKTKKEPK